MKKIILFLVISFLSILNINALTLSDGLELPEQPDNLNNYIITNKDTKIYLYTWNDDVTMYVNSALNKIYSTGQVKSYYLNTKGTTWLSNGSGNNYSIDVANVLAVNTDIYDSNNNLIIKSGFGLKSEATDIGVINDIAHLINDFMIKLNENGIEFWQIIIGLILFNFVVFVICYLITHFSF